jgi:hypothetical protein
MSRSPLILLPATFGAGVHGGAQGRSVEADITARLGRGYVRIGALLVPPTGIAQTLHRYAHPLICENDSQEFPYSIRGTNTALYLGGRYFFAFCRHQIDGYDPSKVTFFPRAAGGTEQIGGGTAHIIERHASNEGEEFLDVVGWEVNPEKYEMPNPAAEFFPVVAEDCWPNNTGGGLIAYGVPSGLQAYEPADDQPGSKPTIAFRTVVVSGRHMRASHAASFHEAKMIRTGQFPVDGMSGGPVFHIGRDARGPFIGLAGMIMRAGEDRFHFIETTFLRQLGST